MSVKLVVHIRLTVYVNCLQLIARMLNLCSLTLRTKLIQGIYSTQVPLLCLSTSVRTYMNLGLRNQQ